MAKKGVETMVIVRPIARDHINLNVLLRSGEWHIDDNGVGGILLAADKAWERVDPKKFQPLVKTRGVTSVSMRQLLALTAPVGSGVNEHITIGLGSTMRMFAQYNKAGKAIAMFIGYSS